jgi:hypothetical protein
MFDSIVEEAQSVSLEWLLHVKSDDNEPTFTREQILEELTTLYTAVSRIE